MIALLVQPEFIRNLLLWLETGSNLSRYTMSRVLLSALKPLLVGLYEALPIFSPAGEAGDRVLATLRVAPGDFVKLAEGVAYTLVAGALAFLLSTARLRARRSA